MCLKVYLSKDESLHGYNDAQKCGLSCIFFMSTSVVLCQNLVLPIKSSSKISFQNCVLASSVVQLSTGRGKYRGLISNAKKKHAKKKKRWWQRFFFNEDGNWFGLKDEETIELLESEDGSGNDELSEYEKFEAWKSRAEAIVDLREAQDEVRKEEGRRWEDWLADGTGNDAAKGADWIENSNGVLGKSEKYLGEEYTKLFDGRGLVKSVRDIVLGGEDDDILYEDRVFRYASYNSAKFLAVLVVVPWMVDILVHDYVLMPFLDRYVKTVPLAAEIFDVRRSQKREIVKVLKLEKERYRLEVEIGKSPSLSDEDLYLVLRKKALALQEEWRFENRKAFANIWSDMVFGVSLFSLLYLFQSQVALLKFTGYKLLNNLSDTGKAFLIILITDIFLGYHSESGWQTLVEVIVQHYGFEVDKAAITIFICTVPVVMDACVKLWLFKYLPRLSTKVSTIFQEMRRH